ncbi:glycosyl transferase [Prolixibacter bellariivorans]|uniref:Glycosyl transferase n=2 Tax=Prolixibacter bellariivorans TaxID=314319 RepID=A0A5M4B260_9BACT|nr:glycosyl transferase [Prolixibacter bellariivorans]
MIIITGETTDPIKQTKMKIVIIASNDFSLINFRKELILEFRNRGFNIVAAAPPELPIVRRELSRLGIKYYPLAFSKNGRNPIKDILFFFSLLRILIKEKPDYLLSYTIKPVIYGNLAGRFFKNLKRYSIISGLGYIANEDELHPKKLTLRIIDILYRMSLKNINGLFFQNYEDVAFFLKKEYINSPAIAQVTMGSGVNTRHFTKEPFPWGTFRFLLVSRLLRSKGIAIYADAARIVKTKFPSVEFDLLGGYDLSCDDAITPDEIQNWEKEGLFHYRGTTSDVRPYLKESTAFVLPSYYREGIPRSIMEAMATGRPIITTDAIGCRNTVKHGQNGLLVKPRDVQSLADAMIYLIEHPDEVKTMGEKSRQMAVDVFEVTEVNKVLLEYMDLELHVPVSVQTFA